MSAITAHSSANTDNRRLLAQDTAQVAPSEFGRVPDWLDSFQRDRLYPQPCGANQSQAFCFEPARQDRRRATGHACEPDRRGHCRQYAQGQAAHPGHIADVDIEKV